MMASEGEEHSVPRNPLAEVFGYPTDDFSLDAERHRRERLCPFHNNAAGKCTKVSVTDPLGVCSVFEGDGATIVCPVRFREGWRVADDAASFFFAAAAEWVRISEVSLADQLGADAGNIDLVLVAHNGERRVVDFGALEVQAVYNSGTCSSSHLPGGGSSA